MSEDNLIEGIKRNPELFSVVYNKHFETIFNYCFRRTQDFNTSKDIASETFLKAFLGINKFKWKGVPILSWLYRIATNEINLHYRKKKYLPTTLNEIRQIRPASNILKQEFDEKSLADKELQSHQEFLKVIEALNNLSPKYQTVISLKYFEKLKIREISKILNKPEGTIKSLLSRGIKLLKQQM